MTIDVNLPDSLAAQTRALAARAARHNSELEELCRVYFLKKDSLYDELTEALAGVLVGEKIPLALIKAQTNEIIIPANHKITKTLVRKLAAVYNHIHIDPSPIRNKLCEIIGTFEERLAKAYSEFDRDRLRVLENTPDHRSLVDLTKRSEAGDAEAQYELGNRYYLGWVYGTDHDKAETLLLKAAEQGHMKAQLALGNLHGPSEEGVKWYQKAADQKSVEALVALGDCYQQGWGTGTASYKQAGLWYRKAAEQNNTEAQYKLAVLCEGHREYVGKHVFPDNDLDASILYLYYAAAEKGHTEAQKTLGDYWSRGRHDYDFNVLGCYALELGEGDDIYENNADADEVVKRAKRHDFQKGYCIRCGRSSRVCNRFQLSCEWGNFEAVKSEAERWLSPMEDKVEALKWYWKAALQGRDKGRVEAEQLGDLYVEMGDKRKAAYWYHKARLPRTSSQIRALGPKNTW